MLCVGTTPVVALERDVYWYNSVASVGVCTDTCGRRFRLVLGNVTYGEVVFISIATTWAPLAWHGKLSVLNPIVEPLRMTNWRFA